MKEKKFDFTIRTLGKAKIVSPIKMSMEAGDGIADYVTEDDRILFDIDTLTTEAGHVIPEIGRAHV